MGKAYALNAPSWTQRGLYEILSARAL